ncbi:hypothetical protein GQ43DRAFT_143412, partial [Delitschia confertaspora ATCC 74209]
MKPINTIEASLLRTFSLFRTICLFKMFALLKTMTVSRLFYYIGNLLKINPSF